MKILVVEDERRLAEFIKTILEEDKNEVRICDSIEEVLRYDYHAMSDFIVLDLFLLGRSGKDLIKALRRDRFNMPILVLSGFNQTSTKVEVLNLGADDYLTKPFEADELKARINALYRRYLQNAEQDKVVYRNIEFFRRQNTLYINKEEIILTTKESDLLELFLQNKNKIIKNEDILMRVWKAKVGFHSNIIQATIKRLRKKLANGECKIKNVHGVGYKFLI